MRRMISLIAFAILFIGLTAGQDSADSTSPDYRAMAERAVDDLVRHHWVGDAGTGHIRADWTGRVTKEGPRGSIWEPGMMVIALESRLQTSKDPILRQRIDAEWKFMRRNFDAKELGTVGDGSYPPALDDAICSVEVYLTVYRATGESRCLDFSKGVMDYIWKRWHDEELGGGCWYTDKRESKSLVNVDVALEALRLYEITGERKWWDRAISLYEWSEARMRRPDNLYGTAMKDGSIEGGPDIGRTSHGFTLIGHNMAVGIMQARLYRDTGRISYRNRAFETAKAIRQFESDGGGRYASDDATGQFVGEWAAEVLTLPGIPKEDEDMLRLTARAIATNDRTPEGWYGECWNGPLGAACPRNGGDVVDGREIRKGWEKLTVNANATSVIIAASALDVRRPWPAPRRPRAK